MTEVKKFDSIELQQQLKSKLEELFIRENLEKDVYFIARMNDKMEIPLQIVYQQKEIYKICPNGRYVLQALKSCENIIVNQEMLYVIPKIIPKKVRIYVRISDTKTTNIDNLLNHIKEKSNIPIAHIKVVSPTSAFLTVENEEITNNLYNWIVANKIETEPSDIQLREENLYKVFRNNVKDELSKYYEKLNEDKKATEMYENLQFFQSQQNFPITNRSKVGDNIFANPFNYFFFQQPVQEHNLQPSIRKSNGESAAQDMKNQQQQQQQQQQQFNPLAAFMMLQQPQMFGVPQGNNSRRGNNHFQGNGKNNKGNTKGNNRSKSRGQVENNNNNNSLNRSKSRKRQDGGKFSEKKGKNFNNRSGEKIVNKDKTTKKSNLKTKKTKPQKPIVDNEENFPSLLPNSENGDKQENTRHTRKSSAEIRQNAEASPVKKEVTIKVDSDHKEKRERKVSESRDKIRERQVSESRERQIPSTKNRERSGSKAADEIVYVRKGKDVKITYEKDTLMDIFKQIREKITPPTSIIESSKDDFIPVININAPKEIEYTKPTEVELLPLSNPGTPYQGTGSIPYRKSSISRSNIKRKESEKIMEVDETKNQ